MTLQTSVIETQNIIQMNYYRGLKLLIINEIINYIYTKAYCCKTKEK